MFIDSLDYSFKDYLILTRIGLKSLDTARFLSNVGDFSVKRELKNLQSNVFLIVPLIAPIYCQTPSP